MSDAAGTIPELIGDGWSRHEAEPKDVLERVRDAVGRATDPGEALQLAVLGTHVAGEHLGDWQAGRSLVDALRERVDSGSDAEKALWRMAAAMELGRDGDWEPLLARGIQGNEASCRIRVLALAAQGLTNQGETGRAAALLAECEDLAAYGPTKEDPAARATLETAEQILFGARP